MPVLGLPLLLIGLAALPMVAGIYWLRTRFRRQEVSALFLWQSAVDAQGGGRKKSRLQTPLTLFLELLIIALLVLAATAPRMLRAGQNAAVVVVLDDSYSMLATGTDGTTARQRAIDRLRKELSALPSYTVRLIAAAADPQVLGKPASNWQEVEAVLNDWQCKASTADLTGALALATEIGGPRSRLLVLSDHAMPEEMRGDTQPAGEEGEVTLLPASEEASLGRLRWLAIGQKRSNLAITNAVRSHDPAQGDALLVEVVNHSDQAASTTLTLKLGTPEKEYNTNPSAPALGEVLQTLDQQQLDLQPGETKRLWFKPNEAAGRPVVVTLEDDALASDNLAVLMPADREPLAVSVQFKDAALQRAVTQAIEASGRAVVVSRGAVLRFTDELADPNAPSRGSDWVMRFDRGQAEQGDAQAQAFLGPFVIDYDHPLAEGLSLTGLVWSVAPTSAEAPPSSAAAGNARPVVMAGDQVLLSDEAMRGGGHLLTCSLWPERSTLLQSPAFPIMVWNIIQWRQSEQPNVSPVNARPGVPIRMTTTAAQGQVRLRHVLDPASAPSGQDARDEEDVITVVDRRAVFSPVKSGVYEVLGADKRYRLAVNGGSQTESDLRAAGEESFGRWDDQIAIEREYQGLSWLLGLIALVALGAHALWLSQGTTRASREVAA